MVSIVSYNPEVYTKLAAVAKKMLNAVPDPETGSYELAQMEFSKALIELGVITEDDVIESIEPNMGNEEAVIVFLDNKPIAIAINLYHSLAGIEFALVGVVQKANPLADIFKEFEAEMEAEDEEEEEISDEEEAESTLGHAAIEKDIFAEDQNKVDKID